MPVIRGPLLLDGGDPINKGLLGFWPLNESGGNIAGDLSAFRRRGQLVNGPTRGVSAHGRDTRFDRASSQYISVGTDLGVSTVDEITVSARVFVGSTSDHGCIFRLGHLTNSDGDGFGVGIAGTGFEGSGNDFTILYDGVGWLFSGVAAGFGWRQITFVLSDGGRRTEIYNNNQLAYTNYNAGRTPLAVGSLGTSVAQIGGYLKINNRYFSGYLQALRVWRRALRPGEAARLALDPYAGTQRPYLSRETSTDLTLSPGPGAVTYTGQAATVRAGAVVAVGVGAATYTGQQASVAAGASVAVGAGAVAYQGHQVAVPEPVTVAVGHGTVAYQGQGARVLIGDDARALGGDDAPARREDIDRLARRRKRQEAEQAERAARLRQTLERAYRAATGAADDEAETAIADAVELAPPAMRERIADVAPMLGTAEALAELRSILVAIQDRRERLAREDDELALILAVL
jgi:hypothetical protein